MSIRLELVMFIALVALVTFAALSVVKMHVQPTYQQCLADVSCDPSTWGQS